jgi:hypothetical protein
MTITYPNSAFLFAAEMGFFFAVGCMVGVVVVTAFLHRKGWL